MPTTPPPLKQRSRPKAAAYFLHRGGINGRATECLTGPFVPDTSKDSDIMTAQQEENAVKEAGGVHALPCGSACRVSARARSFDLGEDAVRPSFGKVGQPGEKKLNFCFRNSPARSARRPVSTNTPPTTNTGWPLLRGGAPSWPSSSASSMQQIYNSVSQKGHGHRMVAMGSAAHARRLRENRQLYVSGEKLSYGYPKSK